MKTKLLLLAGFGLAIPAAHAATTLYSHSFSSTSTANLNGTAVEGGTLAPANWASNGTAFRLNGTTPTAAVNSSAILPFTPVTGMVYTVTATVASTNGSWGGIGFSNATAGWETSGDPRFTGTSNAGQPWMIHSTGGQSAFLGPRATNSVAGTSVLPSPTTAPVTLRVELDTRNTAWTASYFVNNIQFGATTAFGTNPTITAVGLTSTNSGQRTFKSFEVTEAIPEPSAALLGGLGTLLLLRRRR